MIITRKMFIDETAWYAIMDKKSDRHTEITEQFEFSLNEGTKFFTSNIAVGNTVNRIKENMSADLSLKFNEIMDEAHLGNHLRILWIGRRTQKEAMRLMRKHPQIALQMYDFAHAVLMERRRISTVMTERSGFKKLGYTVLPETSPK